MKASDILILAKLEKEYQEISGKKWGSDTTIKDPYLRRVISAAQTFRLGRITPNNEMEIWLEELCVHMGNNSFVSPKSGILFEGSRPNYEEAANAANMIFQSLNIDHQVSEQDFPSITTWERREEAFQKQINISDEGETNLLSKEKKEEK